MSEIARPQLYKIPGISTTVKESRIKDLTKLSQIELLDLKERERKLLEDKAKLKRLPDKGKRIAEFYSKVLDELQRRSKIDEATALFSELNIAAKGQQALDKLEWNGRLTGKHMLDTADPVEDVLDSDDDVDPLRIIAQGTMHERQLKILPPEKSLIKDEDLEEIKSFQTSAIVSTPECEHESETYDATVIAVDVGEKLDSLKPNLEKLISIRNNKSKPNSKSTCSISEMPELEPHIRYLVEKTEIAPAQPREKFKPYKTTISNVHDPEKERARKQGKHWEITAATPPPIQHNGTKMLTLLDSVEMQANYLAKLKELQEEQAAERLKAKLERLAQRQIILPEAEQLRMLPKFNTYRIPIERIEGARDFDKLEEIHDTLDDERGGSSGITYTVYE